MLRTELRRPPLPALALASTQSTRLASAGAGAAVALAYAGLCLLLAHPAVAPGSEGLVLQFPPLLWSALATAAAAPFVFYVLRRLDKGFLPADAAIRVR